MYSEYAPKIVLLNVLNVVHIHCKDTLFCHFKCIHNGKFTSVPPLGSTGMYFCTFRTGGVLVPVSVMCTLGLQQLIRRRLTGFPPIRDSAMYFCESASVFL